MRFIRFEAAVIAAAILWVALSVPAAAPAGGAVTAPAKAPMLVFEIDEGMPTSLVSGHKSKTAELDAHLANIDASLVDLTARYPVTVLIYPTHHYVRDKAGTAEGMDTSLRHTLDHFSRPLANGRRVGVILELYSSGIATNQNGRLASVPMPPLRAAGTADKGRRGLSMDLDTLRALKRAYPGTLVGVRFHEVYGSDIVWRVDKQTNGFPFDPELVRETIAACRETDLLLIWSDSNWLATYPPGKGQPNFVYSKKYPPCIEAPEFAPLQGEARKTLGKNVCFSWANNNYDMTSNLEFLDARVSSSTRDIAMPLYDWLFFDQPFKRFPMKDWPESRWGMSIQSWFWHELTATLHYQYYVLGENNCPVEILESYVLKGLAEGADVLQFEPPWYFFNMEFHNAPDFAGAREGQADYSGRIAMKRLKRTLLDPARFGAPPRDLGRMFDRNQQRFLENDITNPPLNYSQCTVVGLSRQTTAPVVWDSTCYRREFAAAGEPRFIPELFPGGSGVKRIELQGDGVDEMAVEIGAGTGRIVRFIDQNSGVRGEDAGMIADNPDGRVVAWTTANLIPSRIGGGDPDEIVVARSDAIGRTSLKVCAIQSVSPDRLKFQFAEAAESTATLALKRAGMSREITAGVALAGLWGLRTSGAMRSSDQARAPDTLAWARKGTGGVEIVVAERVVATLPGAAELPTVFPADMNHDFRDELCWTQPGDAGSTTLMADVLTSPAGTRQTVLTRYFLPPGSAATSCAALRRTILLNCSPKEWNRLFNRWENPAP
ncbi:MAG: hypothetical protein NTY46_05305 [Candidatus Sumerlaeota bacterium]|nr:hypothetical protein [Candidatus Sumerlaeota bacterium]